MADPMKPQHFNVPVHGVYFTAETGRYHLSVKGDTVRIRLVEIVGRSDRLHVHMPAGNLVEVFPGSDIDAVKKL